jgi:CheY-like chemotaxis protein
MCKDFKDFLGYQALVPIPVSRDVIATDNLLPGDMEGIELIRRLKGYERTMAIAVIALTACVWSTDRERAHMEGSNPLAPTRFNRKH